MDEKAILEHIQKHRDQLYRFALRTVWDSSMAEDVFASAVLSAFENRHKFIDGTNFRAWMFKILVNKCFVANRDIRRGADLVDIDEANLPAPEKMTGYGEILKDPRIFLESCGDEVYHAFRRLSTAQRSCILLKDVEHFSYKEIAETLAIPVATVMTHLARGRALLRKELLEYAQKAGIVRSYPRLVERGKSGEQRALESVAKE